MNFDGRELNHVALWQSLGVPLAEHEDGEFSSLHYCPNPDHDNTRTPSFQVNLRMPLSHCFSRCGIQGNYEHAVSVVLGCSKSEARRYILGFCGGRVSKVTIEKKGRKRALVTTESEVAKDQQRLERGEFSYLPTRARDYLDARGIDAPTRGRWMIGFDEESERIVVPAYDDHDNFRFLIKRAIRSRQQPKYLYTQGVSKTAILFGLLQVGRPSSMLVLVEGSLDAIVLQRYGVPAVATLGSGLSEQQARIIDKVGPESIVCMFDRDAAGVRNVQDAREKLHRYSLYVARYPKGVTDPAEHTNASAQRALEQAVPVYEFERRVRELTTRSGR